MPCPVRCISRCGEEKPGVLISRPVSAQTVDASLTAVMFCLVSEKKDWQYWQLQYK